MNRRDQLFIASHPSVPYMRGDEPPRRALLYETTPAAPLLTALHDGETVTLRDAPAADPIVVVAADPPVVNVTDPIVVDRGVLRGTVSAHGAAGRVTGTGRIIGIEPPGYVPTYAMPTHLHDLYAAINATKAKLWASAGRPPS